MQTKRHLSLKDCYRILQVSKKSSYEEVKRSYRKKAFALHPDLNPGKPEASSNFQLLNEAYVKLSHFLKSQQSTTSQQTSYKNSGPEPSAETKQNAHEAYAKEKTRAEQEQQNFQSKEKTADSQNNKAQDNEAQSSATQDNKSQDNKSQDSKSQDNKTQDSKAQDDAARHAKEQDKAAEQKHTNASEYEGSREDVLKDLLSDPFAKRVFQDIYSEINKKINKKDFVDVNVKPVNLPPKPRKPKKINMEWGNKKVNIDFTHGIGGMVKNWLRSQIDESQSFKFPAAKLRPGTRLRFQIRRGFAGDLITVEITLPLDFAIGKPVRLKGLGKKVGPWQGDLYLLLEPLGA